MKNNDHRFERYMRDPIFNKIVSAIEGMFYSDARITYEDIRDAAYVARVRYVEMNPAVTMIHKAPAGDAK